MGVIGAPASGVKLENYRFVRTIEAGGLGSVALYESDAADEQDVCVKIMRKGAVNATREEAIVKHSMLTSPHVVKLREVVVKASFVGVVMEFCSGGSLEDFVRKSKNGRLTETRARSLFQQLMMAVDYTERKGITNRDLKMSNTLLQIKPDGEIQLKISDFGYSIHDVADMKRKAQALAYVAPEVMAGEDYDDKLADIWQCGVMLYAMLYGKFPFACGTQLSRACSEEMKELHARELSGGLGFPEDVSVSADCQDLLRRMLAPIPAERAKLADVLTHSWFVTDLPEEEAHVNDGEAEEPALSMKKRQSVLDIKQLLDFALA